VGDLCFLLFFQHGTEASGSQVVLLIASDPIPVTTKEELLQKGSMWIGQWNVSTHQPPQRVARGKD
jgi:hypothetical protein